MTLPEYQLRWEAYLLSRVDTQENLALQAWFNQSVQATTGKKHPKPKYKKFKQFFDRKKAETEIRENFEGGSKKRKTLTRGEIVAKRMREFQELKKAGKIRSLQKGASK